MATEVDEIGEDDVMWPLMLMRMAGRRDVAKEVDEFERDLVMWPLTLMKFMGMS